MSIAAGSLTRKVTITKRTGEKDAVNQPLDNWIDAFPGKRIWARPVGPNGMTVARASLEGVPIAPGKYSWRIRFRAAVTSDMRLEYKGMIFAIKEVRHDLDHQEYTDLVCEYGANNG